jgi:hypothetical protein
MTTSLSFSGGAPNGATNGDPGEVLFGNSFDNLATIPEPSTLTTSGGCTFVALMWAWTRRRRAS